MQHHNGHLKNTSCIKRTQNICNSKRINIARVEDGSNLKYATAYQREKTSQDKIKLSAKQLTGVSKGHHKIKNTTNTTK